jgi:hypothetical protein
MMVTSVNGDIGISNWRIQTSAPVTSVDVMVIVTNKGSCLLQYTMSHVIDHSFRGNHNREAMTITSLSPSFAYAYRNEYQYRTILSYPYTPSQEPSKNTLLFIRSTKIE